MSTRSEIVEIITALEDDVKQLKDEIAGLGVAHTVPAASETCTVADYLLERLVQLGVTVSMYDEVAGLLLNIVIQVMFGVPGDFNLGTRCSQLLHLSVILTKRRVPRMYHIGTV